MPDSDSPDPTTVPSQHVGRILRTAGERAGAIPALDRVADPLQRLVHRVLRPGRWKDVLHGTWVGHPLHPILTDVAIGCWSSAVVLDAVGGRRSRPAARRLIGLGVLSAVPTALSGLADWSDLGREDRRVGVVHASSNAIATALFALSYGARRRPGRASGVASALLATSVASVGGFLGGYLAFRRAAGVNRNADLVGTDEWHDVARRPHPEPGRPAVVDVEGEPVLLADEGRPRAIGARCSHMGGPLGEGEVAGGCVRCPWHGSVFRLADGQVVHGPATAPQPVYDVRIEVGVWRVRRRAVASSARPVHNGHSPAQSR